MAAHAIRFEAPRAHPRQALFPSRLGHAKYAHGGRGGGCGTRSVAPCPVREGHPAAGRAVETEPEFPSAAPAPAPPRPGSQLGIRAIMLH